MNQFLLIAKYSFRCIVFLMAPCIYQIGYAQNSAKQIPRMALFLRYKFSGSVAAQTGQPSNAYELLIGSINKFGVERSLKHLSILAKIVDVTDVGFVVEISVDSNLGSAAITRNERYEIKYGISKEIKFEDINIKAYINDASEAKFASINSSELKSTTERNSVIPVVVSGMPARYAVFGQVLPADTNRATEMSWFVLGYSAGTRCPATVLVTDANHLECTKVVATILQLHKLNNISICLME